MRSIKEVRPKNYRYLKLLEDHLGGDLKKVFRGKLVYPREIEVHLPADHRRPCNFNCLWCQGRFLKKPLDHWEIKALRLMNKLKDKIPHYVFAGQYTEPMMNPHLITFLATAKKCGANFGIHTNGSMLKVLEESQGWLTEFCRLSTDGQDFLSISLDAGTPKSHMKGKGLKKDYFTDIIEGLKMAVKIRGRKNYPPIRIAYLLNEVNSSEKEIKTMIRIAKNLKVDSLRFSIPYTFYGQDFKKVKDYRNKVEMAKNKKFEKLLKPLMSKSKREIPYIFYFSPAWQDVYEMNFKQCIFPYYQIVFGADGYAYRCSSSGSPTFKTHRLGKITDDLDKFNQMILASQNSNWDARKNCWQKECRCSRMALEINRYWRDR